MTGTKEKASVVVGRVKVNRVKTSMPAGITHVYLKRQEAWALCGAIAKAAASRQRLILTMFAGNGGGKTVLIRDPYKKKA